MKRGIIISTFTRLIKLYKKHRESDKTPLEDYTTEILVGILEEDQLLLKKFVNEILAIPGDYFNIESQEKYYLEDDMDCIVDIVIENEEMICFLENKVNSNEGERQLERYTNVLTGIKADNSKEIYLRYCTKYYDKKYIEGIDFKQLRWKKIYQFLKNQEQNDIVNEYLEFLKSEGMAMADEFNFQDMITLSNYYSTKSKIYECLDSVKEFFESNFGKTKRCENNNGFWLYKENPFGNVDSEVYIGFSLFNNGSEVIPYLSCGIYSKKNNEKFTVFTKHITKTNLFSKTDVQNNRVDGYFDEPLSNLICNDEQLKKIEEWFIEKLEIIMKFKELTKDLNWGK
ncbi:PD-(D/E)XK nuclease family protein [Clostridium sp.]|uniref:PD-(D/E)XK nuclease family protein n=1 Tax=Clostridium sp. TaxID=1506 RepID=UPI003216596F